MGCAACGRKYPGRSSERVWPGTQAVYTSTNKRKVKADKGIIRNMDTKENESTEESKTVIDGTTEKGLVIPVSDGGPFIPSTGQPVAWVTGGSSSEQPIGENLTDKPLSIDERAEEGQEERNE